MSKEDKTSIVYLKPKAYYLQITGNKGIMYFLNEDENHIFHKNTKKAVTLPLKTLISNLEPWGSHEKGISGIYRNKPEGLNAEQIDEAIKLETVDFFDAQMGEKIGHPGDWLISSYIGIKDICKEDVFYERYFDIEEWNNMSPPIIDIENDFEQIA